MKNISNFFARYLNIIDQSFKNIIKGQEDLKIVMWWWGGIAYVFAFFVLRKVLIISSSEVIDLIISCFVMAYFSFHIFALLRCSKRKKLTKEEKARLKKDRTKRVFRSFLRKLTLQESLTKWNPVSILIALDFLYILIFFEYIFK